MLSRPQRTIAEPVEPKARSQALKAMVPQSSTFACEQIGQDRAQQRLNSSTCITRGAHHREILALADVAIEKRRAAKRTRRRWPRSCRLPRRRPASARAIPASNTASATARRCSAQAAVSPSRAVEGGRFGHGQSLVEQRLTIAQSCRRPVARLSSPPTPCRRPTPTYIACETSIVTARLIAPEGQ